MSASLKIGADTSDAKKQILDLSKSVKDVGQSKIQIFSNEEKSFIKQEMNKELQKMKENLSRNKKAITELVTEQKSLTQGSKEELAVREQIVSAYKTQSKLAKQMNDVSQAQKKVSEGGVKDQVATVFGTLGKLSKVLALGSLAIGATGIPLGISSARQFMQGSQDRSRLTGMGEDERVRFGPQSLADAGLTEQQFNQRRVLGVSRLGLQGGNQQSLLQQAQFERSMGLEQGSMLNTAVSLRGQFGGANANEAQQKLQASILASGMEDALAPYLESMTVLLSDINQNGMTNTTELIQALGDISAKGERTPEQLTNTFRSINQSVKGATGEANAFMQSAFAKGGIGGGTIGGTRFAMESGGILGLDREEFAKLGFNSPELMQQMEKSGQFSGLGERSGALLSQLQSSAGLAPGGKIKDESQLYGLGNLSNRVFGTQGTGGLEAYSALSQVQSGEMSKDDFNKKLKEIQEGKNPQVERLDKVNSTIAGQTEVLGAKIDNLREDIGRFAAGMGVDIMKAKAALIEGQGEVVKGGAEGLGGVTGGLAKGVEYMFTGKMGSDIAEFMQKKIPQDNMTKATMGTKGSMMMGTIDAAKEQMSEMTKAVTKGVQDGLKLKDPDTIVNKNKTNVSITLPSGETTNRTFK